MTMIHEAALSTRSKLKIAALEAVEVVGPVEFKVADVVSRAGVARGTFYLYFKDSSEILTAISLDFIGGLENALSDLPVEKELNQLLSGVMSCYVDYITRNIVAAGLTYQLANEDPVVMTSFDDLITKWAEKAALAIHRTGSTGETVESLTSLSLSMICMLEGYFRHLLRGNTLSSSRPDLDAKEITKTFVTIWSRSLIDKKA